MTFLLMSITLLQAITFDDWATSMYVLMRSFSPSVWIYYVAIVAIGTPHNPRPCDIEPTTPPMAPVLLAGGLPTNERLLTHTTAPRVTILSHLWPMRGCSRTLLLPM